MRQAAFSILALVALTLVGCGGDSHDAVMDDMVSNMESMNKVLANVKDVESAKKAVPKIKKLGEERAELDTRAKEMDEPTEEEQAELKKKYEERLTQVSSEFFGHFTRIGMLGSEVMEELEQAFSDLDDSSGPDWFD